MVIVMPFVEIIVLWKNVGIKISYSQAYRKICQTLWVPGALEVPDKWATTNYDILHKFSNNHE